MKDIGFETTSTKCPICGDGLNMLADAKQGRCDFCGKNAEIHFECQSMHSICYECATMTAKDLVKSYCLAHHGTDPMALAVEIMNSPYFEMHGAWHHFVVPAVLLTCAKNLTNATYNLSAALEEVSSRVSAEVPMECMFHAGTCGAACGAAVFLSIYLGRDSQSEDMWSLTSAITTAALKKIDEYPGPACCKRDTYITIGAVAEFMAEKFALVFPISEAKCTFSLRNEGCGREQCLYYNMANMLV